MQTFRHYSPQLSRQLVSRLYHQAKAERIPMTVLANQLVEEGLKSRKLMNKLMVAENKHVMNPH